MTLRKHFAALLATAAWLVAASSASAAFPDFTGCPTGLPDVVSCVDIQNASGNLNIKGFNVPLGESLEIRGAVREIEGSTVFAPATGTNGFISDPVAVPGGLLGIEWIPGTNVLAITELAGDPEDIILDLERFGVAVPVKVRLVNILLGMNCHIGTDSSPVMLNLITGTTAPPPPNRPISGRAGRISFIPPDTLTLTGNVNVENSFSVPGASRCGLGLGLINLLVNAKLRLPSAAGNNSIDVVNNIALRSTL